MRTTLTIDDDVLYAAKEIAHSRGLTTGEVISEYFRHGFATARTISDESRVTGDALVELGIEQFDSRGVVVTNEDVNRLREDLGI